MIGANCILWWSLSNLKKCSTSAVCAVGNFVIARRETGEAAVKRSNLRGINDEGIAAHSAPTGYASSMRISRTYCPHTTANHTMRLNADVDNYRPAVAAGAYANGRADGRGCAFCSSCAAFECRCRGQQPSPLARSTCRARSLARPSTILGGVGGRGQRPIILDTYSGP